MTFMNQHGDYRAQIDFQISRIELFSAPQIDETAFIRKAVCQERKPDLEQTDLRGVLEKDRRHWKASSFSPPRYCCLSLHFAVKFPVDLAFFRAGVVTDPFLLELIANRIGEAVTYTLR